jgi:hypothetical protein
MKRRFLALTLVFFMIMSLLPVGVFANTEATPNVPVDTTKEAKDKTVVFTIDQKNYKIGDEIIETDVAPYIKDLGNGGGRTMVPVAYVAPALGTDPAKWFPNDRMVLITKGEKQIAIFIDKTEMLVNGKKVPMDVAAEIKDIGNGGGRTMLPIAFIARALEVGYEWDEATRSVYFYGYTRTYDQKGTFGPDAGIETIDGSVVVKADGVILQNMLIKGNLTIAEEVGDGDVTLNNITVKGETYIRGGKDSIHINGGQYNNITIQNVNGKVRVVAKDVTGAQVVVAEEAQGQEIILEGTFEKVTVEAEEAKITTQGQTTINQIEVKEQAAETTINLAKDTVVKEMVVQAKTDVQGQGTI